MIKENFNDSENLAEVEIEKKHKQNFSRNQLIKVRATVSGTRAKKMAEKVYNMFYII